MTDKLFDRQTENVFRQQPDMSSSQWVVEKVVLVSHPSSSLKIIKISFLRVYVGLRQRHPHNTNCCVEGTEGVLMQMSSRVMDNREENRVHYYLASECWITLRPTVCISWFGRIPDFASKWKPNSCDTVPLINCPCWSMNIHHKLNLKKALNCKYCIQNFINIFKLQQISNYANQQQN